jgi:hypothetical protein
VRLIVVITARYFQVSTQEILGRVRTSRSSRRGTWPCTCPKSSLGAACRTSPAHHTTIMHAVRKIERRVVEHDPITTTAVEAITIELDKAMAQCADGVRREPRPTSLRRDFQQDGKRLAKCPV